MTEPEDEPTYTPGTREISDAREEAKGVSSELFDAIGLNGKVSEPGPGVALCGEKDPERFYKIHHPWSVTEVPVEEMTKAMERLKKELPERGWKIVRYGPDKSPAENLELVADSTRRQFSVNISVVDRRERAASDHPDASDTSLLHVDLVSACFQVPEGRTVDEY